MSAWENTNPIHKFKWYGVVVGPQRGVCWQTGAGIQLLMLLPILIWVYKLFYSCIKHFEFLLGIMLKTLSIHGCRMHLYCSVKWPRKTNINKQELPMLQESFSVLLQSTVSSIRFYLTYNTFTAYQMCLYLFISLKWSLDPRKWNYWTQKWCFSSLPLNLCSNESVV